MKVNLYVSIKKYEHINDFLDPKILNYVFESNLAINNFVYQ
jgi:hypothetical protein